ncbi:winged helix-turn-helix transcriptional regulator [Alkalibacter rhizosphaerae]|uniref:Winged helix-turn-helix transcriptional regulator n=1 Tax=Alkalibacter rhizosphaerae TaxID=2815577 RepID=A0A975AI99_9FIRM|nr:metalloregulator ArsR/SmtB family transcription factor [Alkalibacter rhizosphaerae]QSX08454.1 winged helix-turn-helix transcriptional regulator [Alkalibacter rhizosphaerae]
MEHVFIENAKLFKALGDPKRLKIIELLSKGEMCACKILEAFEMSQSTLSHHLKILSDCGLIKGRNEGKWIHYSLNKDNLEKIQQLLEGLNK